MRHLLLLGLALSGLSACSAVTDFDRFDEDPVADAGTLDAPMADAPPVDAPPTDSPVDGGTDGAGSDACVEETCNGLDDDCDGMTDEGFDTLTDPANCGGCDIVCEAGLGADGVCTEGACEVACQEGRADCDGDPATCETVLGTIDDCASCNDICGAPTNVTPVCEGSCGLGDCLTDFGDCDENLGNGCEVYLPFSASHCGGCGIACTYENAEGQCNMGTCELDECFAGFADCDGEESTGCEAALGTVMHCGACDDTCTTHPQVNTTCTESGCFYECQDGFDACDGDETDSDGCEADLSQTANCGSCGNSCDPGEFCDGTDCVPSCTLTECGGACVDTDTNTSHCGGCGVVCPGGPNGDATCAGGSCGFACDTGFADCDSDPGCEASLSAPTSCGSCGNDCQAGYQNGSAACDTGTCVIGTCNPGFADCDGDASNGCEADLASIDHCTDCGNTCSTANGIPVCGGDGCAIGSCNDGFGQCDTDLDCEPLVDSYADEDGDTYGVGMSPVPMCPGTDGFATVSGDCNDGDPGIHPDAEDDCNRRDDDCDAHVDEDLLASDGTYNVANFDSGRSFVLDAATRGQQVGVLVTDDDGSFFFGYADHPDDFFEATQFADPGEFDEAALCTYSGGFIVYTRSGPDLFRQRYLPGPAEFEPALMIGSAPTAQDLRCAQYNGSNGVVLSYSVMAGARRELRAAVVSALATTPGGILTSLVGRGDGSGIHYDVAPNGADEVLFAWVDARSMRTARFVSGSATASIMIDGDTMSETAVQLTRDSVTGRFLVTAMEGVLPVARRVGSLGQIIGGEDWTNLTTGASWVSTASASDGVFTRTDSSVAAADMVRQRAAPPYPSTEPTFSSDAIPVTVSAGHPVGSFYSAAYWMEGSDLIQEPLRCED